MGDPSSRRVCICYQKDLFSLGDEVVFSTPDMMQNQPFVIGGSIKR